VLCPFTVLPDAQDSIFKWEKSPSFSFENSWARIALNHRRYGNFSDSSSLRCVNNCFSCGKIKLWLGLICCFLIQEEVCLFKLYYEECIFRLLPFYYVIKSARCLLAAIGSDTVIQRKEEVSSSLNYMVTKTNTWISSAFRLSVMLTDEMNATSLYLLRKSGSVRFPHKVPYVWIYILIMALNW